MLILLRYKTRNNAIAVTPLNTQGTQRILIALKLELVRHGPHNVSYETMEGKFSRNLDRAHELL